MLILLACWTRFIVQKVVEKVVRIEHGNGSKVILTSTKSCNLLNHFGSTKFSCYNIRSLEFSKAPFSGFNIGSATFFDGADDAAIFFAPSLQVTLVVVFCLLVLVDL